ncbi:hypothetical protein RND71_029708 [Anisodus tanguticus]|uniref:Uncharacterized protein n=1 Tax=Anisodus tanguticus TaxID=243964 RepID=A0AAE1V7H0_9SOLA|nr:hypothetical protein RND71_029708 [Anisodus tanguticus]
MEFTGDSEGSGTVVVSLQRRNAGVMPEYYKSTISPVQTNNLTCLWVMIMISKLALIMRQVPERPTSWMVALQFSLGAWFSSLCSNAAALIGKFHQIYKVDAR